MRWPVFHLWYDVAMEAKMEATGCVHVWTRTDMGGRMPDVQRGVGFQVVGSKVGH